MSRIFITGGIGSGKTFSAQYLSNKYGYRHVPLDAIYFDLESTVHREKRSPESRNAELLKNLKPTNTIFDGWHFGEWLVPMYKAVNLVLIIEVDESIRVERILQRYALRKAGMEYDPFPNGDNEHLNNLIKWTKLWNKDKIVAEIKRTCSEDCIFIDRIANITDVDIKKHIA
jgi:dephospho-CoA kinase